MKNKKMVGFLYCFACAQAFGHDQKKLNSHYKSKEHSKNKNTPFQDREWVKEIGLLGGKRVGFNARK